MNQKNDVQCIAHCVSITNTLLETSKIYHQQMIACHQTYNQECEFSTWLYPIIVYYSGGITCIPSSTPKLKSDLESLKIFLCQNMYKTLVNIIIKTPPDNICYVGVCAEEPIMIWYCPIIEPSKELSNIIVNLYILLDSPLKVMNCPFIINYKPQNNYIRTCCYCTKSVHHGIPCPKCTMIYCNIECQNKDSAEHKPFCNNLEKYNKK